MSFPLNCQDKRAKLLNRESRCEKNNVRKQNPQRDEQLEKVADHVFVKLSSGIVHEATGEETAESKTRLLITQKAEVKCVSVQKAMLRLQIHTKGIFLFRFHSGF